MTEFLRSLSRHKSERRGIHAIPQMRRRGTIVENMAQMRIAFSARHCRSDHAITRVSDAANVFGRDRLPEAWPAGSRIELRLRVEQGIVAANTAVEALVVQVPILSRVGDFGVGVAGYFKSARSQLLPPFVFGFDDLRDVNRFQPLPGIGELNNRNVPRCSFCRGGLCKPRLPHRPESQSGNCRSRGQEESTPLQLD